MTSDLPNLYCGKQGCPIDQPHGHGTDPADPPQEKSCSHERLGKVGDGTTASIYLCSRCGEPLTMQTMTQEAFGTALDAIAGTMSAVLFDYTERMQERYGIAPDDVRSDDKPYDCEADGHVRDHDGICQHCGNNPFLGADEL